MEAIFGHATHSSPIYPYRAQTEVGFYVVCNDRMILDNINDLLKRKGMVGISDTAGHMHYLVDGRRNIYEAAGHIASEALRAMDASTYSGESLMAAIEEIVQRYRLDPSLLGTRILRSMLVLLIGDPSLVTVVTKQLYPLVGKEYGISVAQIERNLRYAMVRTTLHRDGLGNVQIIRRLYDDLVGVLLREKKEPPRKTLAE
jgi:Sporulation initiation factor Spo0A C terminal